jgi:putative aminopeptidase FrvX
MFDLIKTLTELPGPSGYEDAVQNWLARRWRDAGLEVRRTKIGNLLAHLGGRGPKLLIGAHADEISFRVKSVDERGYLWLTAGRGVGEQVRPEPVPLGLPAHIMTAHGIVEGVFAALTGHVLTRKQRAYYDRHGLDWRDFFVDIGVANRGDAERMGVHPGCPVMNAVSTRRIGGHIVGKALDDRAALAIMTMLAEQVDRDHLTYDVWFASTVMEESGLVGARSVIDGFDLGLILEVGLAGDVPLVDPREMPTHLGGGPILVHKDAGAYYSRDLINGLQRCAQSAAIPVQHAIFLNFRSDGLEWILEGVPAAMMAFPCRYTHSPYETADERDLEQMLALIRAFLSTAPARGSPP